MTVVNPIIYGALNGQYKEAYKEGLAKLLGKNQAPISSEGI